MANKAPRKAPPSPRRPLGGFIHLFARFYQNYRVAILRASRRKRGRGVDVDVQLSKDMTMWALHWPTVGKNKLHHPSGKIKPTARIRDLTDDQIRTLVGPRGQIPHQVQHLVNLAASHKVRLELELKVFVPKKIIRAVIISDAGQVLRHRDLLQFKVRAALPQSLRIITTAHDAGGETIMSWEDYHGRGIPKDPAWSVVDYSRGRSHWI